jgi:hypothetical protein
MLVATLVVAACRASGVPSPSPSPSSAAPPAPTTEEALLLDGLRFDAAVGCVPIRDGLPSPAIAGIRCEPGVEPIESLTLYRFATEADLVASHLAAMRGAGVEPRTGACFGSGRGEYAYVPGDDPPLPFSPYRQGCHVDAAGRAHYQATVVPTVLVVVDGTTDDTGDLESWAFLGNQDTPGEPTVWREP